MKKVGNSFAVTLTKVGAYFPLYYCIVYILISFLVIGDDIKLKMYAIYSKWCASLCFWLNRNWSTLKSQLQICCEEAIIVSPIKRWFMVIRVTSTYLISYWHMCSHLSLCVIDVLLKSLEGLILSPGLLFFFSLTSFMYVISSGRYPMDAILP